MRSLLNKMEFKYKFKLCNDCVKIIEIINNKELNINVFIPLTQSSYDTFKLKYNIESSRFCYNIHTFRSQDEYDDEYGNTVYIDESGIIISLGVDIGYYVFDYKNIIESDIDLKDVVLLDNIKNQRWDQLTYLMNYEPLVKVEN